MDESVNEIAEESQKAQEALAETGSQVIGRASATEREPNSAERFCFWIRLDQRLNPFDIVAAEHLEGSRTYGLVTNIRHVTDAASHLSNFISNDFGELVDEPNTPRQGTNIAEVAVLSNDRDIYMPVQSEARIFFADEAGIHSALGIDRMREKERIRGGKPICIPAGLIQMSNGSTAVAYLDAEYVLGPESGHVNISGISGLATKTSYIMFLIQSILQCMDSEQIAVILLNVKYDDLLHIHESGDLAIEELKQWGLLGLKPEPWPAERVHYLLPMGRNTKVTERPNSFGEDLPPHKVYAYDLRGTADKLDLLFSHVPDPSDTLGALIGEVSHGLAAKEDDWRDVRTWDDLLSEPPLVRDGSPQAYRNVRRDSVGRFLRLLRRIVKTRQSGIFVSQLSSGMTRIEEELGKIQGGHTYVIDIAKLTDEEQTLVFGDILRTIYGLYSGETLLQDNNLPELPERVIIFVDELNKYAPAGREASKSPILEQILDIAERGRSFGIILFSAQQFMSAVHPRVTGNSATKLVGRTDSAEINQANYRFLDQDIKMHVTRLNQGGLILSHPIYRQPMKIRFPRTPYRRSR